MVFKAQDHDLYQAMWVCGRDWKEPEFQLMALLCTLLGKVLCQ